MRVLFIEHDHVSPPGAVGQGFLDRGYRIDELLVVDERHYAAPGVEVEFPDPTAYDAVVVMGATWGAYEDELIGSWLLPELDLARRADAAGVPVLGICFGAQMLARAHGGSVARSPAPEIGWSVVHTDDPSMVPQGPWFQWHGDRWSLPPGATEVARNASASQAFVLRRNMAVQFHPELDSAMLKGWLDNGGADEARARGLDPDVLLAHVTALDDESHTRAEALVGAFLDRVAGGALPTRAASSSRR